MQKSCGGCSGEGNLREEEPDMLFWHKLFISSALYCTRMMFPYPMPLGAVLNNRPLASGLCEGISSGASISQFVLCNLRRTVSIKSERKKRGGEKKAGKIVPTAVMFSSRLCSSPRVLMS